MRRHLINLLDGVMEIDVKCDDNMLKYRNAQLQVVRDFIKNTYIMSKLYIQNPHICDLIWNRCFNINDINLTASMIFDNIDEEIYYINEILRNAEEVFNEK